MADIKVKFIHPIDGRSLIVTIDDRMTKREVIAELLANDFIETRAYGYSFLVNDDFIFPHDDETFRGAKIKDDITIRILPRQPSTHIKQESTDNIDQESADIKVNFMHPTDGRVLKVTLDGYMTQKEAIVELIANDFIPPQAETNLYSLVIQYREDTGFHYNQSFKDAGVIEDDTILIIASSRKTLIDSLKKQKSTRLDLSKYCEIKRNILEGLPRYIKELPDLTYLNLSYNELGVLPKAISQLNNLEELSLRGNKFTTIPNVIFSLSNLKILDLSENQLTNIPAKIVTLANLEKLILNGNKLSRLPLTINWLNKLKELHLENNPLHFPPIEIVKRGTKAIKNYLGSLTESKKLYETKLLIVGEGAVGKTCIANKLINQDFDIERHEHQIKSTKGIEITSWTFDSPKIKNFK